MLHVLLWKSNDSLWGNILVQASNLNFVLTCILVGNNNLGFSCDWKTFVSSCNTVDSSCILLVPGLVGWVASKRWALSGGEGNDEDCKTPAICWFTVTANTEEGIDLTDTWFLISVSAPLAGKIDTLKKLFS